MLKKNSIQLDDLFSQITSNHFDKNKEKLKEDKINNLLSKKIFETHELYEALNVDECKKNILEKANLLNYEKAKINPKTSKLIELIWVIRLMLKFTIGVTVVLSTLFNVLFGFFCMFNILNISTTNTAMNIHFLMANLVLTLVVLIFMKNKKINSINALVIHVDNKLSYFLENFFNKTKLKDSYIYYNSDIKSVLYYEQKTDDELFNKFLLEEIKVNEDNDFWNEKELVILKKEILEKASKKYEKYLEKKEDMEILASLLNNELKGKLG